MFEVKSLVKPFLLIIGASSVMMSCQPEIDGDVPPPNTTTQTDKVKSYSETILDGTDTVANELFNVFYNANDKISSLESATHPGSKFTYTYSTGQFAMDIYQANVVTMHVGFLLNSASKVDSSFQYNIGDTDTTTEKYAYNSVGWISSVKRYSNSASGYVLDEETKLEYDALGNVTKETSPNGIITYTYYADLKNPLQIHPEQQQVPYLVKTTTGSGYELTHTYKFDSKGRLSEERAVDKISGATLIRTYTYY